MEVIMKQINCKFCNSVFIPRRSTTKFCSRYCQAKWLSINKISGRKKQGVNKICVVCNKIFYVSKYRKNSAIYCSRKCLAIDKLSKYRSIYGFKKSTKPPHIYKTIKTPEGKTVREHRYVMEKHIGRKLKSSEHVHHIDGNSFNNHISNLIILTNSEHQKLEYRIKQKIIS